MSWGRLEDTFHDEPKFYRAADRLGVSFVQIAGHVSILWSWAHRHAPDGDLRDFDVPDIERAAKWDGDQGAFVDALAADRVELIDRTEHGFALHRFKERAEAHKAAKKKAKQRLSREREKAVSGLSRDNPRNVPEERRGEEREEKRRDQIHESAREGPTVTKRQVRPTRGAFEQLFEGMFSDAGKAQKIRVAKFDPVEQAIAGAIIRRCAEDSIDQQALIAEWWHPSWRAVVGWRVSQLERHYAAVVAAMADPSQRPKAKSAAPATSRAPPVNDDSEKRRRAFERQAAENKARLDAMHAERNRDDQT